MLMSLLFAGVSVVAIAAIAGMTYVSPIVFAQWAKDDFFFSTCKEGQGKAVVAGESFRDAFISYDGWHLNKPHATYFDPKKPKWEILPNDETKPMGFYDERPKWMQDYGLYWVGLPWQRHIYRYTFQWNEFRNDAEGAREIWKRDANTKVFMVNSFPYAIIELDLITGDGVRVKVIYLLTMHMTNPYLALFNKADWRTQIEGAVGNAVRNFVGSFTYKQLRSETDEAKASKKAKENFSKDIKRLNVRLHGEPAKNAKGAVGIIGVTIDSADLQEVFGMGPLAEKYDEVNLLELSAPAEATAKRTAADASAYEILTLANARAAGELAEMTAQAKGTEAQLAVLDAHPESARLAKTTEALGKAGAVYIELPEVLKGALGKFAGTPPAAPTTKP